MENLYFTILKLGVASLKTWAAAYSPVVSVAEPNKVFKAVTGSPWVRIDFLPAQPWPAGLGVHALNENKGLFQFSLNWPLDTAWGQNTKAVDSLCSAFKRGTRLVENDCAVTIEKAWPSPGWQDGLFYITPISVAWNCYASN